MLPELVEVNSAIMYSNQEIQSLVALTKLTQLQAFVEISNQAHDVSIAPLLQMPNMVELHVGVHGDFLPRDFDCDNTMLTALQVSPRLQDLSIVLDCRWDDIEDWSKLFRPLSRLTSLTSLSLVWRGPVWWSLMSVSDMWGLALPSLHTLEIHVRWREDGGKIWPALRNHMPSLRNLALFVQSAGSYSSLIGGVSEGLATLTHLHIEMDVALDELELGWHFGWYGEEWPSPAYVTSNGSLKSLRLINVLHPHNVARDLAILFAFAKERKLLQAIWDSRLGPTRALPDQNMIMSECDQLYSVELWHAQQP